MDGASSAVDVPKRIELRGGDYEEQGRQDVDDGSQKQRRPQKLYNTKQDTAGAENRIQHDLAHLRILTEIADDGHNARNDEHHSAHHHNPSGDGF